MNKFLGIGRLTADPKYTPATGDISSRLQFRIAVNRIKSSKATKEPGADYINCVAWGSYADLCSKHLYKGKQVAVDGRLTTNSKKKDDGTWDNFWNITIEKCDFLLDTKEKQQEKAQRGREGDDASDLAKRLAAKVQGKPVQSKLVQELIALGLTEAQAIAAEKEELAKQGGSTSVTMNDEVSDPFAD